MAKIQELVSLDEKRLKSAVEIFTKHLKPFDTYLQENGYKSQYSVTETVSKINQELAVDRELKKVKSSPNATCYHTLIHMKSFYFKMDGKGDASILCYNRVANALEIYLLSNQTPADLRAFKNAYKEAIDIYAITFRKYGDSTICDHLKSVGMALLGVIVTLLTSPAFLIPNSVHNHSQWIQKQHFFAGPETTKSKEVQRSLGDIIEKLGLEDNEKQQNP